MAKYAEIKRSVMEMESICTRCVNGTHCEFSTEDGAKGWYQVTKCTEFVQKEGKPSKKKEN